MIPTPSDEEVRALRASLADRTDDAGEELAATCSIALCEPVAPGSAPLRASGRLAGMSSATAYTIVGEALEVRRGS